MVYSALLVLLPFFPSKLPYVYDYHTECIVSIDPARKLSYQNFRAHDRVYLKIAQPFFWHLLKGP